MAEERAKLYRYRILRYTPNLIRDEWVNIGVLLEDIEAGRRGIKLIDEDRDLNRIRQIHPSADRDYLRSLPLEFDALLRAPGAAREFEKLDQALSNVLQWGPQRAAAADDFHAELDRLFRTQVAAPPRVRAGVIESTRNWIKERVNDVFRRRRVPRLERDVPVEEFTERGDPFKFDYAYRNGVLGYMQAVTLSRDPAQGKVLAYTAGRIRRQWGECEFTAITESEPVADKPRHQFLVRLFAEQDISIVSLNNIERFAENLRQRLQ
jgi:hypothetical protein